MRPEIMRDVWDGRGRQQSCRGDGVRFHVITKQGGVVRALFGKQVCCVTCRRACKKE